VKTKENNMTTSKNQTESGWVIVEIYEGEPLVFGPYSSWDEGVQAMRTVLDDRIKSEEWVEEETLSTTLEIMAAFERIVDSSHLMSLSFDYSDYSSFETTLYLERVRPLSISAL
jgi:hypothetical protein